MSLYCVHAAVCALRCEVGVVVRRVVGRWEHVEAAPGSCVESLDRLVDASVSCCAVAEQHDRSYPVCRLECLQHAGWWRVDDGVERGAQLGDATGSPRASGLGKLSGLKGVGGPSLPLFGFLTWNQV